MLTLLRLIIVAGGTPAFAERAFSLSRCIKTWLRAGMNNSTFDDLGLPAWHSDEIDDIIDSVEIVNDFIELIEGKKWCMGLVSKSQTLLIVKINAYIYMLPVNSL